MVIWDRRVGCEWSAVQRRRAEVGQIGRMTACGVSGCPLRQMVFTERKVTSTVQYRSNAGGTQIGKGDIPGIGELRPILAVHRDRYTARNYVGVRRLFPAATGRAQCQVSVACAALAGWECRAEL
jgi:hypothetical protein